MKRTLPPAFGSVSIHPFTPNDIQSDPRAQDFKTNCIITSSTSHSTNETTTRGFHSIRYVRASIRSKPSKSDDVDVTEGTRTSHLYASHTMSHASTLTRVQTTSTVRTRRGSSARRGASVIRASGVFGASLVHSFTRSRVRNKMERVHDDRKPSGLLGRVELVVTLLFVGGD